MSDFDEDITTLTTSQAARLLSVHGSTVKRWCSAGELPFESTEGGHRRIRLRALLSFAKSKGVETFLAPFVPFEEAAWYSIRSGLDRRDFEPLHALALEWLRLGQFEQLSALFLHMGMHHDLPFSLFLDEVVSEFMDRIGEGWEAGHVSVMDEHLASQVVLETLLQIRTTRPRAPHARTQPRAVVGSMGGNQHHLGSLGIRVLLETLGFTVSYLGPDVPVEEFGRAQRMVEADLVCVSLPPPGTVGDMVRCTEILSEFYREELPFSLFFGGGGLRDLPLMAGKEKKYPFEHLEVFPDSGAMTEWIVQQKFHGITLAEVAT